MKARRGTSLIISMILIMSTVFASVASADRFQPGQTDGDTLTNASDNIRYGTASNWLDCGTRGTAVTGKAILTKHDSQGPKFAANQTLALTGTVTSPAAGEAGISIPGGTVSLPEAWRGSGSQQVDVNFSTTVAPSVPDGTYTVTIKLEGVQYQSEATTSVTDTFGVVVNCSEGGGDPVDPLTITDFSLAYDDACTVDALVEWEGGEPNYEVEFEWGDDSTNTLLQDVAETTATATHTYAVSGTYEVTATVTDSEGESDSDTDSFATKLDAGSFLQPINTDGTRSAFRRGSTIPVKITVEDCAGDEVSTLSPTVQLRQVNFNNDAEVEVEPAINVTPTNGKNMRWSSTDSQYIFNLSTKKSQFNNNNDLVAGTYRLTVTDSAFFSNPTVLIDLR